MEKALYKFQLLLLLLLVVVVVVVVVVVAAAVVVVVGELVDEVGRSIITQAFTIFVVFKNA